MIKQQVIFASFCTHNYQKSLTNKIELKCLNNQNLVHVVSQVGKVCNRCSEILMKSLQTSDHCLVCAEQVEEYLRQKQICPHQDQQFDEASIKCRNDPKQIHYVPLKAKVCKICLSKIHAAFNISDDCKVCSGNQNLILDDIEKNIVSPIFFSVKNIIKYLSEQKVEDHVFKDQLQYFCKSQWRPEIKSQIPAQLRNEQSSKKRPEIKSQIPAQLTNQQSSQNHLSKRYSLYPKCPKHRNLPVELCNKCLVGVLNLKYCPYGCTYDKQKKQKIKTSQNTKISQTGFLCVYPQPLEDSCYLDLFVIRQIQQKGRLDRWESNLRKVRPLDSITNKYQKYFCLYSGSVFIGDNMYLNCGGVIGGSITTKQVTNISFLLRLTDDYKNFQISEIEPMKNKRASHAVTFHKNLQRVYVVGGYVKQTGCLRSCQYYDKKENKWVQMGELNIQRSKPTTFIYQNQLYAFGGMTTNPKINQFFGERYNQNKKQWQLLSFSGFDYPSLTGSVSLTSIPCYQNKKALWMIGGSNYQDYSTIVQNLQISKRQFSLNVDYYLKTTRSRCNCTLGLINSDIIVVFGGLKQHQPLLSIQAIKCKNEQDYIKPMFVYEPIQMGSYRLLLRQSCEHVYSKLYQNLQQEEIVRKQKLDRNDNRLSNGYNSHMLEKMYYTVGKNFVWVDMTRK